MNKRQHERHSIEHPAIIIMQDGLKVKCRIQNYSLGGLYIAPANQSWLKKTDNSATRNTVIAIQIRTPRGDKGSSIIIQAVIAHVTGSGLGVAFVNRETELLDYLHRLTRSNARRQAVNTSSNKPAGLGAKETSLANWVQATTRKHLASRYPDFIKSSYNILFDAANNAGNNQDQRALYDAYNILKQSQDEIRHQFQENIDSCFADFKRGKPPQNELEEPQSLQSDLELVAKKDFDEWVSVVSLTRNLDRGISSRLHKLENTLSYLSKLYINNESNPISPYSLLWSFKKSLNERGIKLPAKKLLFRSFQKKMLGEIATLYDDIIQYLSDHGISHQEPEKPTPKPKQATTTRGRKGLTDTLSSLMGLMGGKRKDDKSGGQPTTGVAPREMVVQSLRGIHTNSRRPIIQRIEEQLEGEVINGQQVVVDSQTRDAIQVSENLLGSLQQDFSISPEIQNLIDNLKLPFVKETINDPNLLSDTNHPGHKLLDTIGKLTPYLPTSREDISDKGYLFQTLEEISRLTEQGTDLDIREITTHLEHLVDHQKEIFKQNLDFVTESCEQDERYLAAQNSVTELLFSMLTDKQIPKLVEKLLHLGWPGLMIHTLSSSGGNLESIDQLTTTIAQLLDIFGTDDGLKRSDRETTEQLVQQINAGFQNYQLHQEEALTYTAILQEFFDSDGEVHTNLLSEKTSLNKAAIRQLIEEQTSTSHRGSTSTDIEKSWIDLVAGIKLDDWIVEQRQQGHVRMLNLAWINQAATRYVFIDGEGKKSLDTEKHDLAQMFKQQQCSLLENGNLPIVERTVNRLLKNTFDQIKSESETDELTGLLGRKGFQRTMSELLEVTSDIGDQHAILKLDIDQFSVINDLCGFKGGDKLLKTFANILRNYIPENATLARIGDDEFGILIKNCSLDEAYHIAENQRRALENLRYTWDGTDVPASTSIGIVKIDSNSTNTTQILNQASSACKIALKDGGNCTKVYQPSEKDIEKRQKLAQAVPLIEDALNNNKLALFAQPITPLFMGEEEDHHYEILLRVKGDNGEWGSPVEFIQAAERYNRMRSVDRWVINHMFAWLGKYHQEVEGTGFSINLSAQTLDDASFAKFIADHVERSPFPNNRLTLEITETSLVQHIEKARALVENIKSKGVKFSLDDFGTGYSSYSYLKDFPVDNVKIDGVFIKDILTESSSYAMVKSITEISHHMEKKVVAEYVESEAILVALRELEVDFAQGYSVGHPVPLKSLLQHRL